MSNVLQQTSFDRTSFRTRLLGTALIALSLGLTACTSTTKSHQSEANTRLRLGTNYLIQGKNPAALRELRLAEKLDPKNPLIQNNLGLAYFLRGRHDLAQPHLERALELDPNYVDARNNLARNMIELGRYQEAITNLEKVIADLTYEEPAKAWFNLGLAYFRKGEMKTARDKFAESIRVVRENCLGQTFYGRTLLELNETSQAAQALDNAIMICRSETFDEPYYFSGLSYYKLGKTSSAIARMEEVIKMNPTGQYAKKADSLLKLMK